MSKMKTSNHQGKGYMLPRLPSGDSCHIYQEIKPIIYTLACFGTVHFYRNKESKNNIRCLSVLYCTLRLIFDCTYVFIHVISLLFYYNSERTTLKISSTGFALLVNLDLCYLIVISSSKDGLFKFLNTWKEVRLSSFKDKSLSKKIRRMFIMQIILLFGALAQVAYTTFNKNLNELIVSTLFPYMNETHDIWYNVFILAITLVGGILGSFTHVFIHMHYYAIAFTIAREFDEWNSQIQAHVTANTLKQDSRLLEKYRLKYEKLCQLVGVADHFVSWYIAINLSMLLWLICFMAYNVIMYEQFNILAMYMVICSCLIVVIISGGAMVSTKVCYWF